MKVLHIFLITLFFAAAFTASYDAPVVAQNDVMMQAFYWEPPVDEANFNGTWWDNLRTKASAMSAAGFTGIWVPPPSKGNWGITDMGYGIYDHHDLGNYSQKGTTETRFGSRSELESMIGTMHSNGIEVYADIILNHIYGSEEDDLEPNPAVLSYVQQEAYTGGSQHTPYPTNEIVWRIPNAAAGDYYIQIKGYELDWGASYTERGYDVYIDWTGAGPNGSPSWESEPNNGGGNFNVFPASGRTVRGHANYSGDLDEYKVTLSSQHDIVIKLIARREQASPWEWQWADQTNGYYPYAVWHNGSNLANSTLQAQTATGINYVTHTGTGEPNYSWNYTHFHPVDGNDWLGDGGGGDGIITNTKWFGNDLNTFSSVVATRLQDWGEWLCDEVEFDGFRLDFVRGFQPYFAAEWIKNLPLKGGNQRFIVAEYWGSAQVIHDWVDSIAASGADADAFDFPLKFTLTDMANGNQSSFNMAWLNHSGMVRNNSGQAMSGTEIVTFTDNHDSGKEHDKWITKDWDMAYAYTLTHEGRPCVFYPHYYGVTLHDNHTTDSVEVPSSVGDDIDKLIYARKTYLGGSLTVLSEVGNPVPSGDTYHLYVARRAGNGTKSGAIICINNHDSNEKSLWVDTDPTGWTTWANDTLVNAFDYSEFTVVQSDGRVEVSAPSRGYKIWVKKDEYVSFAKEADAIADEIDNAIKNEFALEQNYPNPFNPTTQIAFTLPTDGNVSVKIFNSLGQSVAILKDGFMSAGRHELQWDARNVSSGMYIYVVKFNNRQLAKQMMLLK